MPRAKAEGTKGGLARGMLRKNHGTVTFQDFSATCKSLRQSIGWPYVCFVMLER